MSLPQEINPFHQMLQDSQFKASDADWVENSPGRAWTRILWTGSESGTWELNPAENVWEYLRGRWLSNHVFADYDAILDAVCDAWNRLIAEPDRIQSIGTRDWACCGEA